MFGNLWSFSLTTPHGRSNHSPVAAKSATGFDSSIPEAHQRPSTDARRFFDARIAVGACQPALWRAVCGGRKACRSSGRSVNRAPSATSFDSGVADSIRPEEFRMSYDAQEAPANAARQIAYYFGLIADTLDWKHEAWLALSAKLQASGKPPHALDLAVVQAAIDAVRAEQEVL